MNRFHPKKLPNSKWTAVNPIAKEKHFLITKVTFDDDGLVISCVMEAVISRREVQIEWQDLKDIHQWLQGWL